ncbi:SoxR reducing system RseC family protein [sulfur-oxidizing endosymbiont of Gigantopelta aegis]|uniref:SoxR reducing system RseC family protein n=1 Tax=sulfur-oxidizing endosymbiont of Gigantopelta aegis TaxID=2794934 RepID=UPI0018DC2B01|nr:SoxR reducing system RseC family protein [sulfur-oxidizing endosymbiont of Gigantopelta aegis]
MIEEQAVVIKCEQQYVWVQTQRQSSCGHCSVKNGCGTQLLSKVLGNKTTYVRCLNPDSLATQKLKEGDRVLIGLQESALLNGSFLMYLLPLASMILFAGLAVFSAKSWWPEGVDLFSIIGALLGLVLGFKISRLLTRCAPDPSSQDSSQPSSDSAIAAQYEPVILKKLSDFVPINIKPIKIQYDS